MPSGVAADYCSVAPQGPTGHAFRAPFLPPRALDVADPAVAAALAGLEANTLADGFFHLATWLLVAVGAGMLVQAWRTGKLAPPWRAHIGMLLAGWGIFNVVEGLIDHELLGIHHVRDDLGGPIGWDLAFLALGAVLIVVGFAMARHAERAATVPTPGRRAT